jgi:hypothetical protein
VDCGQTPLKRSNSSPSIQPAFSEPMPENRVRSLACTNVRIPYRLADQVLVGRLGVLDAREHVHPEIHVVLHVLRIDRRTYPPGGREVSGVVRERVGEVAV